MPLKDPPITVDAERFCQLAEDIMIAIRKATDPAGLKMFVRVSPNQTARAILGMNSAALRHMRQAFYESAPPQTVPSVKQKVTTDLVTAEKLLNVLDGQGEMATRQIMDGLGLTDEASRTRTRRTLCCLNRRMQVGCRVTVRGKVMWWKTEQ